MLSYRKSKKIVTYNQRKFLVTTLIKYQREKILLLLRRCHIFDRYLFISNIKFLV